MIKLIKSTFYNEDATKRELNKFISGAKFLRFGDEGRKFEKSFAAWQGQAHAVFVNSGSSANLAIIQALLNLGKIKRGDLVGFSAMTWSTNVMPLIQLGLRPVPIDIEIDTLNVSSKTLEKALTRGPLKMLFLTNLLGFCDDIDVIAALCKEKNILLIEDNCESLGTRYRGKKLGNYGYAATFSFFVGHHMSTVEGGAVCTDDQELATMLKMVRAHGWDREFYPEEQRNFRRTQGIDQDSFYTPFTFYDLGYNLRPTDIQACLGNIQLRYLDQNLETRENNFRRCADAIYAKTNRYYPLRHAHVEFLPSFATPVVCRTQSIRDELVKKCRGVIEVRPIVGGDITAQPFWKKYVHSNDVPVNQNARLVHERGLYFGNDPELTEAEVKTIIEIFAE